MHAVCSFSPRVFPSSTPFLPSPPSAGGSPSSPLLLAGGQALGFCKAPGVNCDCDGRFKNKDELNRIQLLNKVTGCCSRRERGQEHILERLVVHPKAHTYTDTRKHFTHTLSRTEIDLMRMYLVWGKKPKKANKSTGGSCGLHTEKPRDGVKPRNPFLLSWVLSIHVLNHIHSVHLATINSTLQFY